MRITDRSHEAVRAVVRAGDTVIDATLGNGHDTLFLAQCVGPEGTVHGFDVQEEAVESARRRLSESGIAVRELDLVHAGHESVAEHVRGAVTAVMFNLGYLPGGDHERTTRTATTLAALAQAANLLLPGGVITIVCYRSHPGGAAEADEVCAWADRQAAMTCEISGRDGTGGGPFLVVVRKDRP